MAKKHVKKCSKMSLIVRELQFLTRRYHYNRTLKLKKTKKQKKQQHLLMPNADGDAKQQESSFTADGNAKCTVTLESSLAVSYKAKCGPSV